VLVLWAIPPLAVAAVSPEAAKTLAVTEVGGLAGYQLGGMIGSYLGSGGNADGSAGGWFVGSLAGMIAGAVTAHRLYKGRRNPIAIVRSAPNGFIVLSSHGSEQAAIKAADRRPESNITIVHQPETSRTKARWFVGRAVTGGQP
jgi:outer membrane lipoprotein SlyB